ncbi:cathepsin C, putative [Perkinsus marinus ATCC 50983]|uniref:Cathepsin C, putative n=1 Tax=Perkinsus marinus (strain ATCC 50983 / TXsc) TaxID=423536 RepID=C5L5A1_PERM5|nr:cathepsin C, putative [Perkinsus marinus ATCC 50983]EER08160.1 cathepsin C, putative [Perkinsus marinus ATCC 50983]|eukprot:XP_002776344.1 cathepsin C, putative [Perkinsus marinus ATCC 50983]
MSSDPMVSGNWTMVYDEGFEERRRGRTALHHTSLVDSELSNTEGTLPDSLDWRNVEGVNYIEPVMNQGSCGSCYAIATMRMLSARHKIHTRNITAVPWSISYMCVNFPLYCAEYNQGCDGGFSFLTSKWSSDVGLLPTSCAEYTAENGKCEITCDPSSLPKYRVSNYHYVGGYYGGITSSAQIMKELVDDGPLVVSIKPAHDMMYYRSGVYRSDLERDSYHRPEWEEVGHSVLLIGYGVDNGEDYWLIQNSWGPEWGEDGYLRLARGMDESGVESIAVAADVVEDRRPLDTFKNFEIKPIE